jgi:hypothetical protein
MASASSSEWACEVCTFLNEESSPLCIICGVGRRPTPPSARGMKGEDSEAPDIYADLPALVSDDDFDVPPPSHTSVFAPPTIMTKGDHLHNALPAATGESSSTTSTGYSDMLEKNPLLLLQEAEGMSLQSQSKK